MPCATVTGACAVNSPTTPPTAEAALALINAGDTTDLDPAEKYNLLTFDLLQRTDFTLAELNTKTLQEILDAFAAAASATSDSFTSLLGPDGLGLFTLNELSKMPVSKQRQLLFERIQSEVGSHSIF